MSLTLTVDGDRWRSHLRRVAEQTPGLVPVLKGNGYGFGLHRLRAARSGCATVARRRHRRRRHVRRAAGGRAALRRRPAGAHPVAPVRRRDSRSTRGSPTRVIHTAQPGRGRRRPARAAEPGARFVLELVTSMLRHGLDRREPRGRRAVPRDRADRPRLEGIAIHLPARPRVPPQRGTRLITHVVAADLPARTLWVSHLTADELDAAPLVVRRLRGPAPDRHRRCGSATAARCRSRPPCSTSTRSSGATSSATAAAPPPSHGHLVVVSGGTAHGIGLEAPHRRHRHQGPRRHPGPRRPRRGRVRALAVQHRRQAAALRRATPHAGVDAVPAPTAPGCPRSATRSTCGCATPPRRSTSRRQLRRPGRRTGSCSGRSTSRTTRPAR